MGVFGLPFFLLHGKKSFVIISSEKIFGGLLMDEKLFVKMRDCFTAGYTLPQFCIDKRITRPLFVSEKRFELFLWEVYIQFNYDRRLIAKFCFIDAEETKIGFNAHGGVVPPLKIKNISDVNFANFDKIILLTEKQPNEIKKNHITFSNLQKFFIRRTYCDIPLLKFLQRYPKVKLFITNFPSRMKRYKGGKKFDSQLIGFGRLKNTVRIKKYSDIETPLDKFGYTHKQINEIVEAPDVKRNLDGSTEMLGEDDKLLQKIENGKRATAFQPENYLNKIYFFGSCHQYGVNAPFDKTIESYLQKMLNDNNLPYRVENEGQMFRNRYQDMFYNLNYLDPAPNDIIFVHWHQSFKSDIIPFFDLSNVFDPPHDYKEIFCTKSHVNEIGYKLIAERFFEFLTENNFFRDVSFNYPIPPPPCHRYGILPQFEAGGVANPYGAELETYKQTLRENKIPIGALVMNCNPFTLGHQYLVEYAAAKVTQLYIFVVEEDKSAFPFADRIELVRQGVKHIPNVEVLPSGKFIISQQTFSGYFNKAELQDVQVDSSQDVEIFGKEIAPTLGITIRFAGEEPTDNVTRQYNETMKKILPRYGVEFCEIPRKTFGDEPISASKVREALKFGDFDKIKSLVPETTFNYLREHQDEFRRRYSTARIDIKLIPKTEDGDFKILSTSDNKAFVVRPAWFQQGGIGYQIQSHVGKLTIVAKATVDGQIQLSLRGLDIRNPKDKTKRIPYWIDYTKLIVNGQTIFDKLTPTWHNEPYRHKMDAKADEEITVEIEWLPHK